MGFQIDSGGAQQPRIVLEIAEAEIAAAAEQTAHLVADVAMVDVERLARLAGLADGADAVLARQQRIVIGRRHPVAALEHDLAAIAGHVRALRQLAARILCVLLAALGVDAILVRRVPGALLRADLLAKYGVLGKSLPALVATSGHGCLHDSVAHAQPRVADGFFLDEGVVGNARIVREAAMTTSSAAGQSRRMCGACLMYR